MTIKEQMISDILNKGYIKREDYSNLSNNGFYARKSEARECIHYMDEGRSKALKQWQIVFDSLDEQLSKSEAKNMFYLTLASMSSLITLIVIFYK